MGSQAPAPLVDKLTATPKTSSIKRSNKGKVPKRIHKAEREKLKREHLNELFLDLANALELSQQNNGKASILCEATRFLKDLFSQIDSLEKENVSLLSESHYVTMEKNELKEENSILETQISKLQTEIEARATGSKPDLNVPPPELVTSHIHGMPPVSDGLQPPPAAAAILVVPLQSDPQTYHPTDPAMSTLKPSSNVSKPHPRYPTPGDSWPSRLLMDRFTASEEVEAGHGSDGIPGEKDAVASL